MDTKKLYELWMENAKDDADLKKELAEIAGNDEIVAAALHTDDTTVTKTSLGMTDGQVLHRTVLAVDETDAESITGIDLDAGILTTADNEVLEVLQSQLLSVAGILTNHFRLLTNTQSIITGPSTTWSVSELRLILQDA